MDKIIPFSVKQSVENILKWVNDEGIKLDVPVSDFFMNLKKHPSTKPTHDPNVIVSLDLDRRGCSYSTDSCIPLSYYMINLQFNKEICLGEIAGKHSEVNEKPDNFSVRFSRGDVDDVLDKDSEEWLLFENFGDMFSDDFLETLRDNLEERFKIHPQAPFTVDPEEGVKEFIEKYGLNDILKEETVSLRKKYPKVVLILIKGGKYKIGFDSPLKAAKFITENKSEVTIRRPFNLSFNLTKDDYTIEETDIIDVSNIYFYRNLEIDERDTEIFTDDELLGMEPLSFYLERYNNHISK